MSRLASIVPGGARRWLRRHGGPLGSVVAVDTEAAEFVLTYDDGPEPGATDAILAVLEEHGATATFFMLLTRVRSNPGLVRAVVESGHEIALHGVDHRSIARMGFREVQRRTADARAELEDAAGATVRWFRPPYGAQSLTSFRAVRSTGLMPVLWGATSWDSREATLDERRARSVRGADRGTILLCHDAFAGFADGGRRDDGPTVDRAELARVILLAYRERGLTAKSLGDAAASGRMVRGMWFGG